MSKLNQIQNAIRELDGGAYQKLMDVYLHKRFGFSNMMPLGSHAGTNKTTKGIPDSYVLTDSGKYILISYGTVSEEPFSKIEKDIKSCLNQKKTGLKVQEIEQLICCHTSTNISIEQDKTLHSHFNNTIIIGLHDLSIDLLLKYPSIARDHLNIEIDTHQIFDIKDFIEYTSRNEYSTPLNMPLLCREKEVDELLSLLDAESVVLICGRSGSGKTRLAIEIADIYGSSRNYSIKIIKSNNESIYDDLHANFTDDKDYLVIIDDADQLKQLNHLLDLSVSDKRTHRLKILMTVRDYAKESLINIVRSVRLPKIYTLKALDDESIRHILNENLGISNETYLQQIMHIAKGNVRLAIMAGKCAIVGAYESIRNTFDIFDSYFASVIDSMSKKEIITASLIALFDSLIIHVEARPIAIALEQGICFDEFVDICGRLHDKEVVSIFNNLAIKFEDQNLRDYLLYYVFFKKKLITPSYIIKHDFPTSRKRIIYAFNTLVRLFYSEENVRYLTYEIKKAWIEIKELSNDVVFQFIESFHAFIPDETLLMIKYYIDNLPEVHTDFSTYDFEKTSNIHTLRSKIIGLISYFKYSEYFTDALALAFCYLEKNTEYPMDFYFLFGEKFGFEGESYKYNYSQERILVEKLLAYYEEKVTTEAALCLIICVSHCLKYQFSGVESNRDNSFTYTPFGLPNCIEVFEIRSLCFKAMSILFGNINYRRFVLQALKKYPSHFESDSDKSLFENDINAFTSRFSNLLNYHEFQHCIILDHFQSIGERYGVICTDMIYTARNNRIFMIYKTIKNDHIKKYNDWQEAERKRKRKIYKISVRTTNEEFESLWDALEKNNIDTQDSWNISVGINLVFNCLKYMPDRLISVASSYLCHGAAYGEYTHNNITSKLLELLGYDEATEFINSKEFSQR